MAIRIKAPNRGKLHRHFGIAPDQPIPMAEKEEAAHSSNPELAAEGRFAVAAAGFHHAGGKKRKKKRQTVRQYLNSSEF